MAKKMETATFSSKTKNRFYFLLWFGAFIPFILIATLLLVQSEDKLPSVEMLDNPPEMLASIVYGDDGETELGRYWTVNRTSVTYDEISPNVFNALISTEDERFMEHSGVDFKGLTRAVVKLGSNGGASTITQQLAKLLFTLQQREAERQARMSGEDIPGRDLGKFGRLLSRVDEKAQENIIAVRLEKRFTKEEIITMYLNQFDFLYNAVGIENAAKVYFNKTPKELTISESATLVGMVNNPSLYNPRTYLVRDYRGKIATKKGVSRDEVDQKEVDAARSTDSLLIHQRRNQVLMQWLKNSERSNDALTHKLTREEYDKVKNEPIVVDYQMVDHKEGMAPYFRESLRKDLTELFKRKNENGELLYKKKDGSSYDLYRDGLRVYTTINVSMQQYAEDAVTRHLKTTLQPEFDKNNRKRKRFPFAASYNGEAVTNEQIERIMARARKQSDRYVNGIKGGSSESEVLKSFDVNRYVCIYLWRFERHCDDTE